MWIFSEVNLKAYSRVGIIGRRCLMFMANHTSLGNASSLFGIGVIFAGFVACNA